MSGTGEHAAVNADEAREALSRRDRRASMPDLEARVAVLEQMMSEEVGDAPNELKGAPGRGLWLAVHGLQRQVQDIGKDVKDLRSDIQTDRAAAAALSASRAAAQAPFSRAGWVILTATLTCITTSGVAAILWWLAGLHH